MNPGSSRLIRCVRSLRLRSEPGPGRWRLVSARALDESLRWGRIASRRYQAPNRLPSRVRPRRSAGGPISPALAELEFPVPDQGWFNSCSDGFRTARWRLAKVEHGGTLVDATNEWRAWEPAV